MANTNIDVTTTAPILSTTIARAEADLTALIAGSSFYPLLAMPFLYGLFMTRVTVSSAGGGTLVQVGLRFSMVPTIADATGTATLIGGSIASPIKSLAVTGVGGLYSRPPVVTLTGGGSPLQTALAHATMQVQGVAVLAGGTGYVAPTAAFVGGSLAPGGTPAVAGAVTVVAGAITTIAVTTPGGPYDQPPQVVITDIGGSGCIALAGLSVSGLVLDFAGVGYTSAPNVVITPLFKQMVPDASGNASQAATMSSFFIQAMQNLLKSPCSGTVAIS